MFYSDALSKDTIKINEISRIKLLENVNCWSRSEAVSIACRALYYEGQNRGLSGQVSARGKSDCYITQALGVGFDEVSVSNLLVVSSDLEVIEGDGIPNPANRFHSWIYRHRSDVGAIIHVHSPAVSAISMVGEKIEIAHMDTCGLYDEISYLDYWPGIPIGNEEGKIFCETLGNKKAMIMAHHGYLVAATDIPEALYLALHLEYAASLHLEARKIGEIRTIDDKLAREAKEWVTIRPRIDAFFRYQSSRVLKRDAGCFD